MPTRTALLWVAVVFLLSSCASWQDGIDKRNNRSAGLLDSAPESTGLLIADVRLKHKGSLSFGIENSIDVPGGEVRQVNTREVTRRETIKHLLVFQLPPGIYELVSVRGHFRAGNYYHTVEPFLVPEVGSIEVIAGEIKHVGKLTATAHSKLGQLGFTYSYKWDRGPAAEKAALEILAQHDEDSRWLPIIRQQLASLGPVQTN